MVRTFLAISLSAEQKRNIASAIEEWRRSGAAVRWADAARLHLTLKFLGDIRESSIADIKTICARVAARHAPFELDAATAGVFPHTRHPRVLWIGLLSRPEQALHILRHDMEQEFAGAGFSRDRKRFLPHITVGRVKSARGLGGIMEAFMAYRPVPAPYNVESFQLYSSDLRPEGPIYKELACFFMNNALRQEFLA